MNILILGGTQFVGRHIVEAFVDSGHAVTVLTRGKSKDELPEAVERLQGDRNEGKAGLRALTGREWDACVDVSGYTPRQVRASAEELRGHVGRYVFVSTVSVYAEPERHPVREDDPLSPPAAEDVTEVSGQTYGPLKVTCENIVRELYGDHCTVLRPQIVAGPFDHTARYPYWVDRAARGGQVLAPGDGSDFLQVIDARDLARFTVKVVEDGIDGVFNLAGPRIGWADFMTVLGVSEPVWVDAKTLETNGLGFKELPVYIPAGGEQSGLMDVDNARAVAAGLTLSDPAVTTRETREWSRNADLNYALTPEREREILASLGG
ncbi:NAD-dependent epimerase/dehydratase family protein [Deinococcus radiopugnans]|uniref:2'-hydroxyisoflavone reductase n=1 Tax=Deinococcus radiopugnans ATCC 19172 TaxID=585398 RepID=A0A5C4Y660_9DEIO|nr:NAD-dependent epimerase/dehydratase family protein [Deinococcus radiopugnans]MBB6016363.1 2'-hydroxyisoflavone reductase [Deinococcus radiopugnans ATCC 19172]TNM71328.1 NAD-dependent epimerase/dehydratase family protein [Deinococcus radiopugnans ATCC 19172]